MDYYIETVSIRRLAKHLDNTFIKNNCFTSIQVLCELLTDLDDNNFEIKKNALKKIFQSGIFIDWDQPHKKHFESFGFFNAKYNVNRDRILFFFKIIEQSSCFSDFQNSVKNHLDEYSILEKYDRAFVTYFRKEMSDKTKDFRSEFGYQNGIQICDNIIDYLKTNGEGFLNFHIAMSMKMAEDLHTSEINKYEKRTKEEILASYNGNIDKFLIISGIYVLTKVPRNEQISRNDFNDLYHLMYINDGIIVSDDNIYQKYMSEIYPDSIITTAHLLKNAGL
jgi:hypothetical protein